MPPFVNTRFCYKFGQKQSFPAMYKFLIIITSIFVMVSCKGEKEEKFIPSEENEGLPAKTASGNNVAGALVNETAWRSNMRGGHELRNLMTFHNRDTDSINYLQIRLHGEMNGGFHEGADVDFIYMLADTQLVNINNVTAWRGDTLQTSDPRSFTGMRSHSNYVFPQECDGGNGWIHFDKIKEQSDENYLMAGTFGLTIRDSCAYMRVRKGRFDFVLEDLY